MVFGAEPRAEKMVNTAKMAKEDGLARLQTRVKTDAESTAWIERYWGRIEARTWAVPAYRGMTTGTALILTNGQAMWRRRSRSGGDRLLRVISPPWAGTMKMLVREGELVLDAAQMKYIFKMER